MSVYRRWRCGSRTSLAQVLRDYGKQFTDRFGNGGEALFDRICRDNGITTGLLRGHGRHKGCFTVPQR